MAHRINTRCIENGMDSRTGQKTDWQKFFDRHMSDSPKSELLSFDWCGDKSALKAIERRFQPYLVGQHLYWRNPVTAQQICIGYIDAQSERGYYMIALNSEFGEHCEVIKGKSSAIDRVFEIYKNALQHGQ